MYPRVLWYHRKLFLNVKRLLLATTWVGLTQQFSQNLGLLIFALKRNVNFTLRFNSASVSVTTRVFLLKHYESVRKPRTYNSTYNALWAFLILITELSERSSNENKIVLYTNPHRDNFGKILSTFYAEEPKYSKLGHFMPVVSRR